MSYSSIDPIINNWVDANGLHLYKEYKDIEVRSVDVVNADGQRCQIWIDKPNDAGLIGVHVWDFKKRGNKRDFLISSTDLFEYLSHTLTLAIKWNGRLAK